jgi:sugar phosphate isomerase/epimerase
MPSRRELLRMLAASVAAPSIASLQAESAQAPSPPTIETALKGTVGLQMWSLRKQLPTDLPGTLAKIRAMGFQVVESAGLWKHSVAEMRAALDTAGLKCQSSHMNFGRLLNDRAGALAEAKALGASWIVCPWIDHKGDEFTHDDTQKAIDLFNSVGKAAADEGLRFAYHCHGYEFFPAGKITLFDELVAGTDPKLVSLQIDVFHALYGGGDPAALITRYRDRVSSLHLKDLKPGVPITTGTAIAKAEADVPVGSGQVKMAAVLRAAMQAGVTQFYIEDESDAPLDHIPQSVRWLESFKL